MRTQCLRLQDLSHATNFQGIMKTFKNSFENTYTQEKNVVPVMICPFASLNVRNPINGDF